MTARETMRKVIRIIALVAAIAAGLVVLLVLLLQIPVVRSRILNAVVPRVQESLPGTLTINKSEWPSLGTLVFEGVMWVDSTETFAAADELSVSIDLRSLIGRDIHAYKFIARGMRVDVPALLQRFDTGGEAETEVPQESGAKEESGEKEKKGGFPREGAIRGLPSIAVDRIELYAPWIRVSSDVVLRDVTVRGDVNFLSGSSPGFKLYELSLEEVNQSVSIDSLWVTADLSAMVLEGEGAVRLGEGETYYFHCRTSEDSSFAVRLTGAPDRKPPDAIGVVVTGTAALEGRSIRSIEFAMEFMTPGTEELAAYPALAGRLPDLAPLEGAHGVMRGRLGISPQLTADIELDFHRSTWLDTLHLLLDYRNETITVDTLELAVEGFGLELGGSLPPGGGNMTARLDLAGSEWLRRILPDITVPDSVAAQLIIEAERISETNQMNAAVRGHVHINGVTIDTLDIDARLPGKGERPYGIDLMAGAFGITLVTRADLLLSPALAVRFSNPADGAPDRIYLSGEANYDKRDRSASLTDIRLTGALGTISVSAALDSLLRGEFDVACEWVAPPSILMTMIDADSAAWDSVAVLWREEGPFSVRIDGILGRNDAGLELESSGAMFLPGPRDIGPAVGTGSWAHDLGPIWIDFSTSVAPSDSGRSIDVRIDLGRTEWLDTALVDIRADGNAVDIDTVLIVFEGLRLDVKGGLRNERWDLTSTLSLADSQLVRRIELVAGRNLSLTTDGIMRIEGAAGEPSLEAELDGRFSTGEVTIPRFTARILLAGDTLDVSFDAPEGVSTDWFSLDSMSVSYGKDTESGSVVTERARIEARGSDADLLFAFRMSRQEGFEIMADTLYVNVSNRTLASAHPFELGFVPDNGMLHINDLLLTGSIGRMQADGYASADSADLEAHVVIDMPPKPQALNIADRLWPDSIRIDGRIDDLQTVSAKGYIAGMTLGEGIDVNVFFELGADTVSTHASLSIDAPDRSLFELEGRVPKLGGDWKIDDGPLYVDIRFNGYPVPSNAKAMWSDRSEEIGRLDGRIAVRGTASDPQAVGALFCNFSGGQELAKYRLAFEAQYAKEALADTALTRIRKEWFEIAAAGDHASGLSAKLKLFKSDQAALSGELSYPLVFSLKPYSIGAAESGVMSLTLESNELNIGDLDPLLPPDIDLDGTCVVDFSATGDAANPVFNGKVQTKDVSFSFANNAQISPEVDLVIGGELERPAVTGKILIQQALVQLPKSKSNLHPVEGSSVLWEMADTASIDSDSIASARDSIESETDEASAQRPVDLDIQVTIPGAFWIRSERLSIELSGDLRIVQKGTRPILTGELKPLDGRLLFMGRYFQIKRGSVFFYGGDEFNPSFDLTLAADVSDVKIEIRLTGTAQKPEVELASDPQMSESDIMSLLLFGRSLNDLDSSQSNMLQRRTAEVLAVFGMAKLEGPLSQMLGVDMVTFQQSTRDPKKSALLVGKYLNSRTMIKYEQGLENTTEFLINLEYYLTRRLKLETYIDQASETGIEINWSKDY